LRVKEIEVSLSRDRMVVAVVPTGHDSFWPGRTWTFITNHAQVLLAVAQDPELRVAEIADAAGITQRSAYRILADLVDAGYLSRTRVGTHNRYGLACDLPLRDRGFEASTVTDLLRLAPGQSQPVG
jgi:DNA-binding transcriptional ArsR family regulator